MGSMLPRRGRYIHRCKRLQARVWFAGVLKRTTGMPARGGTAAIDQELEWVVDGSQARDRGRRVEVEVWDTRWRDGG